MKFRNNCRIILSFIFFIFPILLAAQAYSTLIRENIFSDNTIVIDDTTNMAWLYDMRILVGKTYQEQLDYITFIMNKHKYANQIGWQMATSEQVYHLLSTYGEGTVLNNFVITYEDQFYKEIQGRTNTLNPITQNHEIHIITQEKWLNGTYFHWISYDFDDYPGYGAWTICPYEPIPEPTTFILLFLGLIGLGAFKNIL